MKFFSATFNLLLNLLFQTLPIAHCSNFPVNRTKSSSDCAIIFFFQRIQRSDRQNECKAISLQFVSVFWPNCELCLLSQIWLGAACRVERYPIFPCRPKSFILLLNATFYKCVYRFETWDVSSAPCPESTQKDSGPPGTTLWSEVIMKFPKMPITFDYNNLL